MSGFLDNYEDVAARIARWQTTYPSGRIETSVVDFSAKDGYILIEARAYRSETDTLAAGIDFAFGHVSTYNVQMKKWFVEDTVSSAIGRVLNLVMGAKNLPEGISNARPTRQNMEQVETLPAKTVQATAYDEDPWSKPFVSDEGVTASQGINEIKEQLGGQLVEEAPQCSHGHRIRKEGTKKDGSAYLGYACPERAKEKKCSPDVIWYNLVGGSWQPQAPKAW